MKISRILLGAAVVVAMTACGGNEQKAEDQNCEGTEQVATEEATEAVEENTEATEANTEATEAAAETTEAAAETTEAPAEAAK